ncbi:MAG: hypothetical protein ACOYOD_01875 [Saprospiraceae bacterium]|jgi:hypothetical protein
MGILALSAIIMASTGFYLFLQSAPNFKPGHRKIQADLQLIREEVLKVAGDLAPVKKEDLELISLREVQKKDKKWMVRNVQAIFTNIFEEPAIAYYYRVYLSNKQDALLFAKTTQHEFFFWIHRGEVQIVVDEQALGTYHPDSGILHSARTKKPIAQLQKNRQEGAELMIQGKQVGKMTRLSPNAKDSLSKRVFDLVKNDLAPEEEAIVLALAIFEMVQAVNPPRS